MQADGSREAGDEGASGVVMQSGLRKDQAKIHAVATGLILDGFTVEEDHAMVLCEMGREWAYSKKRRDQRESDGETREHRG